MPLRWTRYHRPRSGEGVLMSFVVVVDEDQSSLPVQRCPPVGLLSSSCVAIVPVRVGVPAEGCAHFTEQVSSTSVRGCSSTGVDREADPGIALARARMLHELGAADHLRQDRPRLRGGVSLAIVLLRQAGKSSPRVQGCFDAPPIPAGGLAHRPRPRGGVPPSQAGENFVDLSSPAVWGCSRSSLRPGRTVGIVPAGAGVFLSTAHGASLLADRPRPHGGVPVR